MFTWKRALKEAAIALAYVIGTGVVAAFLLFIALKAAEHLSHSEHYGVYGVYEYHFDCYVGRNTFYRFYKPCHIA